jgi:curli biogenesis system outer membrane secretion channel CsgG
MGRSGLMMACALFAAACTATVDKGSVRATQTAPESTRVDVVQIPYDPSLPRYVVTVEPLAFDASPGSDAGAPPIPGRRPRYGWGPWGWGILPEGPQARPYNPPPQVASGNMGNAIASQLETALSNAGNISIIDFEYYLQHKGRPGALVKRGEVGPFIIRGSVTEFNEVAEASGESVGGSLGGLGVALGVAGAIAGNAPAAYTGAGVAAANPTFDNTKARRTGSVAMDLKLVNPNDGRLLGSFVANGSFTSESASSGFSVFGVGKASNAYAASALGQANRAAMNSATEQIMNRLRGVR